MQGTRVWALVWEDPTCRRATKPVHHNCWACVQLLSLRATTTELVHLEPMLRNKRSHCNEKHAHHSEEQPPLTARRESLRPAVKTQCSQKTNKLINEFIKKQKALWFGTRIEGNVHFLWNIFLSCISSETPSLEAFQKHTSCIYRFRYLYGENFL